MTSVLGHITATEFPPDFKRWEYPPPERLFDAPVKTVTSEVGTSRRPRFLHGRPLIRTTPVGQEEGRREHREAGEVLQSLMYLDGL